MKNEIMKLTDEEKLRVYRSMVLYIANEPIELSWEKIKSQRDHWKKLCQRVIDNNEESEFVDPGPPDENF